MKVANDTRRIARQVERSQRGMGEVRRPPERCKGLRGVHRGLRERADVAGRGGGEYERSSGDDGLQPGATPGPVQAGEVAGTQEGEACVLPGGRSAEEAEWGAADHCTEFGGGKRGDAGGGAAACEETGHRPSCTAVGLAHRSGRPSHSSYDSGKSCGVARSASGAAVDSSDGELFKGSSMTDSKHRAISPNEVREIVWGSNAEVQGLFKQHFGDEIERTVHLLGDAYADFQRLQASVSLDERTATVQMFIHVALASVIASLHHLVSGYPIAAGHMMRNYTEAIAMALMCSDESTGIYEKYAADRRNFPVHKSPEMLRRKKV